MPSLSKPLRNELARAVLAARALAEEAAAKALHTLGVDEADAPGHLDNDGRLLRRKLRAQARQLGDREDRQRPGRYEIAHIAEKIGYDHWHRLLFARFLAETDLLISPDHGIGVSLSDCEDLAPHLGYRDGWEVAASFAARMLPQIFRADDPAAAVTYAPEDRVALRKLVTDLPRDIFMADDSLGWCYQFWQTQRKKDINDSGVKIGADEVAPVTQLFTEDYMVLFLLHNTLGAWWAGRQRSEDGDQRSDIRSEEEARAAVALPGINWEYLRFIRKDSDLQSPTSDLWEPAAGTFDGWPKTARELRLLDPSMGSGHFLVFELPILVAMRMAEERLSKEDAVDAVIRDNLFGLEIDPRCTQIAAFNLALAAWKLLGAYRQLPPMNLACCGLGINARKEDWLKLANDDTRLRGGMEQLFDLFQKAPELGSLINPRRISGDLVTADFHELLPLLEQALAREETQRDDTLAEMGVTARGLAQAAEILGGQFTLVATNVPYLGRGKQDHILKDYCAKHHPDAKADLATCFIERCLQLSAAGGSNVLVTPQNWLFLGTYSRLRETLIKSARWNTVIKLGSNAFQDMNWWAATTALVGLTKGFPDKDQQIVGIDVGDTKAQEDKALGLASKELAIAKQKAQLDNPDARINLEAQDQQTLLMQFAIGVQGLATHDDPRFACVFWEFSGIGHPWECLAGTVEASMFYGGRTYVFKWGGGEGEYKNNAMALKAEGRLGGWKSGKEAWGKRGVSVSQMRILPCTLYTGEFFDHSAAAVIPQDSSHLAAVWCFCSSPEFHTEVRKIDQAVKVTNASLVKIPFDLAHWQRVAAEKYPNGLPKPHSDDPTQWLFNGHPAGADQPLQVAVARLLGYRWPRQTGSEFPDCPALGPDGLEPLVDTDGIVCISAIKGEQSAAERLRALLAAAFGMEWSATKQAELLEQSGFAGKTLDEWLRNGFFEQHCQLFHQRPFIWQLWDGLRDGFSVLVNYHKLTRSALEKLTYTYLGDWLARQKASVAAGEEGSDAKLAAAQKLKTALEKILEGESPYDIFVRWKPLAKQPIGWEPDLNDGVRLNIRPFVEAGILRKTPKIHWRKDRGNDVPSAPWYKLFNGDRINDHHLTLAEKREGRDG